MIEEGTKFLLNFWNKKCATRKLPNKVFFGTLRKVQKFA